MISKNLIVIIGNGFDLAHGFKTSFVDFAHYFIRQRIATEVIYICKNKKSSGNLFKSQFLNDLLNRASAYSYDNLESSLWLHGHNANVDGIFDLLENEPSSIKSFLNNDFLGKLYANEYRNWFDIENAYFEELISLKQRAESQKRKFNIGLLKKLNKEFNEIKIELVNYLKILEIKRSKEIQRFITVNVNFKYRDKIYIVDFNYTKTVELYLDVYSRKIEVNYIHGNLEKGNVIFGYGNDQHKEYQEIKELEINEFLEFFKTFEYMKNDNYSNIYENALDVYEDYEVMVLGHSLGSTDKTLLEEIFNSDKCKKIHIFKRNESNTALLDVKKEYNSLIFASSRIISTEKELRKKMINFNDALSFP